LSTVTTLALGIGALAATAVIPMTTRAELQLLTPSQLDLVTAAGVEVDVASFAGALGNFARAGTDTRVRAVSTEWLQAALGISLGQAIACCGSASDVHVGTVATAAGDRAEGGSFSLHADNGIVANGIASAWTLALSSPTAQDFARLGQVVVTVMQQRMLPSQTP
jgi:hypothetical protein